MEKGKKTEIEENKGKLGEISPKSKFSGKPCTEEQLAESKKCWEDIEESIGGLNGKRTDRRKIRS